MPTYTRYAARSGEILDVLELPPRMRDFDLHNTLLIPGEIDGTRFFISDGAPAERPKMMISVSSYEIAANGDDQSVMTGLPDPCDVFISGPVSVDPVVVAGGELAFSADVPGDYTVIVEAFPYIPFEVVIHAY